MVEKRKSEVTRVAALARHVQLVSVSCREVSGKRHLELAEVPDSVTWWGGQDITAHRDMNAGQIVVVANFTAQAREGEAADGRRVADIAGTFALRYNVPVSVLESLNEMDVLDFAELNGRYNAWPYWRELLQTSAARIGLHGVVAPVFRVSDGTQSERTEELSK